MRVLSRIATWWKAVSRSEELNAEIEDELAFHIDAYAEDLMRRGVERGEAYRRARAEFGGVAAQKENCRAARGTRGRRSRARASVRRSRASCSVCRS